MEYHNSASSVDQSAKKQATFFIQESDVIDVPGHVNKTPEVDYLEDDGVDLISIENDRLIKEKLDETFISEINTILGIPIKAKVNSKDRKSQTHVSHHSFVVNNNHVSTEMKTTSERGGLTPRGFDVLIILSHMAFEQLHYARKENPGLDLSLQKFPVFFTISDITNYLGLKLENSFKHIENTIKELSRVHVEIGGYIYSIKEEKFHRMRNSGSTLLSFNFDTVFPGDEEYKFLPEKYRKETGTTLRRVYLNEFILRNMSHTWTIDREKLKALKSGRERKIYIQLCGRRKFEGEEFSFSLNQLAEITGDADKKRQDNKRKSIRDALVRVQEVTQNFEFYEKTIYGKQDIEIFIMFNKIDSLDYTNEDYFQAKEIYGEDKLESLGLSEGLFVRLLSEYSDRIKRDKLDIEISLKTKKREKIPAPLAIVDHAIYSCLFHKVYKDKNILEYCEMNYGHYRNHGYLRVPGPKYSFFKTAYETKRKKYLDKKALESKKKREEEQRQKEIEAEKLKRNIMEKHVFGDAALLSKYEKLLKKDMKDNYVDPENREGDFIQQGIHEKALYRIFSEDHSKADGVFATHLRSKSKELNIREVNEIASPGQKTLLQ